MEASCGARRDGCELETGDIQRLIQLHDKFDALKEHFDKLSNPIMRELSTQRSAELSMTRSSSGYDSLSCVPAGATNRVWLVGHCASVLLLQQLLQQLPDLVAQHYPQSVEWSVVLQSCLQPALDHSTGGDVVLLLPGTHLLHGLGALSVAGGAIHGMGEGVIITGGLEAGDVMMHVGIDSRLKTQTETAGLCLRNITLKPMAHQAAVLVHSSALLLERCNVRGESLVTKQTATVLNYERASGQTAIDKSDGKYEQFISRIVVCAGDEGSSRKGFCKMCDCHIAHCEVGVDVREHSAVEAVNTIITNCHVGLRVHVRAKMDVSGLSIKASSRCAVEIVDAQPGDHDVEVKTLPDGDCVEVLPHLHLADICSSHETVELADNFCDVATAAADSGKLQNLDIYSGDHQLGRLVSESAFEREDPGSNPAADMVDAARNTAWDLGKTTE
ncbi:Pectin lyase fold/virulence factor [Trinorchestia longiramus]|nr:Pectin lyase fold/virulence factor [Trinorchestia longiramus]